MSECGKVERAVPSAFDQVVIKEARGDSPLHLI